MVLKLQLVVKVIVSELKLISEGSGIGSVTASGYSYYSYIATCMHTGYENVYETLIWYNSLIINVCPWL